MEVFYQNGTCEFCRMSAVGLYRFRNAQGADFSAFCCWWHVTERVVFGWFKTEKLGIVRRDRRQGGLVDRRIPGALRNL